MEEEIEEEIIDDKLLEQAKEALMEMGLTEDEAEREVEDFYGIY